MTRHRARLFAASALAASAALSAASPAVAAPLPDGRAYEHVTPMVKGADLMAAGNPPAAWPAETGDGVYFASTAALEDAPTGAGGAYVASRSATGWVTRAVASADQRGDYSYSTVWAGPVAEDLSRVTAVAVSGGQLNFTAFPARALVGPPGELTVMAQMPSRGAPFIVGGDADLSHVVWHVGLNSSTTGSPDPALLDPPATGIKDGRRVLYEWADGQRRLVALDNDGQLLNLCGSVAANGDAHTANGYVNAVSADGSRIFFLTPDPDPFQPDPDCTEVPQLYVRENGSTTRRISAPEAGVVDPAGPQPPFFSGASRDGDRVFFVTGERLTMDDTPNGGPDLYVYDLPSGDLRLVTKSDTGVPNNDGVQWVLTSDDGSTAYVVVPHPLIAGTGVDGQPNLYRYDADAGTTSFVATLMPDDVTRINNNNYGGPDTAANWYTTTNGRFLVFHSGAKLTDANVGGAMQLYRYDAADGGIVCVSCPPAGVTATGEARYTSLLSIAPRVSRYNRPITEDGSQVFFDTPVQLVAGDVNQARDIYAWRDGSVRLISSGADADPSFFVGATRDGRDVFFATKDRLTADDDDDLGDIYDARVGGGFPVSAPPPALCREDACQGQGAGRPSTPEPGSSRLASRGNVVQTRKVRPSFTLSRLTKDQRARFARTGVIQLRIRTTAAGRLKATAHATVGGRQSTVARASRTVRAAGIVNLQLRLDRNTRRVLAAHRKLRLSLRLSFTGAAQRRPIHMTLQRSR